MLRCCQNHVNTDDPQMIWKGFCDAIRGTGACYMIPILYSDVGNQVPPIIKPLLRSPEGISFTNACERVYQMINSSHQS